ncbi:hypothetical protein D917_07675 [Trichinella nativa]|uniref:Uncharacterized protein n=1 Tax=Trichinella nativa TaxID=6335 RepID=A0A1Y3EP03_9BILA|nr:hypothetical protein D917_07675 [Trichinella nativa]
MCIPFTSEHCVKVVPVRGEAPNSYSFYAQYSSLQKRNLLIKAFSSVVKSAESLKMFRKMRHYYYDGGNALIIGSEDLNPDRWYLAMNVDGMLIIYTAF